MAAQTFLSSPFVMPRGTVLSRLLIPNAAREVPGKTWKHYSGWSVSFKKCNGARKASSEGMFLARDLKTQLGSKVEAENEERLWMLIAEGTTLRTKGEGKQQWYCDDIGIPSMSVPLLTHNQTSIWCHLIKTPVPGRDIQHHESNETSANSYNSQTKQAWKRQNKHAHTLPTLAPTSPLNIRTV